MEKHVVRGMSLRAEAARSKVTKQSAKQPSLAKAPPSDLKRSHYFVGLISGLTREETRGAQALTSPGAPQEIAMSLGAS